LKRFNANNCRKDHQQNNIPITWDLTIYVFKKCKDEELSSHLWLFLKYFQKRELRDDFGAEEKGAVSSNIAHRARSSVATRLLGFLYGLSRRRSALSFAILWA
jgi:hypothetical protein